MPRPPTCWNALAPSTELPLVTLLPRAWIGFGKAPWRCVGLATALLLSAIGPALLGEDLRQLGFGWLGDLMVAASLVLPLLPLLALLRLADQLLPAESASKPPLSWGWMLRQATGLVLLELLLLLGGLALIQTLSWAAGRMSTTLAGLVVMSGGLLMLAWLFSQVLALPLLVHHRHRALQAMDHKPATGAPQRLEGAGVAGTAHRHQSAWSDRCLPGPAVEPSVQRPDPDGLLPHSNAMQQRFPPKHVAHVDARDFPGLDPVLHQEAR